MNESWSTVPLKSHRTKTPPLNEVVVGDETSKISPQEPDAYFLQYDPSITDTNLTSNKQDSYGIICHRYNNEGEVEFLVTERMISIAFTCLITGQYSSKAGGYITKLMSNCTHEELELFVGGDYVAILTWLYAKAPGNDSFYYKQSTCTKYYKLFTSESIIDPRAVFDNLIRTRHIFHRHPEWDFPKGRYENEDASKLHCALREFTEELTLKKGFKLISSTEASSIVPVGMVDSETYFDQYTGISNVEYSTLYYTFKAPKGFLEVDSSVKIYGTGMEVFFSKWVTLSHFVAETTTFKHRNNRIALLAKLQNDVKQKVVNGEP